MQTPFDVLTLAARYWFVALLAFVVLRLALNVWKEYRLDRNARVSIDKASVVGHFVWMTGGKDDAGHQIFWLPFAREATIGSAKTCDVRIEDKAVKPEHAQASYQNGVLMIKRIGSAMVKVGDRECPPDEALDAHDGDTLHLGTVSLVVTLDGGMA